jgi:hypothetical protein
MSIKGRGVGIGQRYRLPAPEGIAPKNQALAAKKARGATLGTPTNLTPAARAKGLAIREANAQSSQQNQQARRLAGLLHAQGHSLPKIAQELNEGGYRTRRGNLFFPMSVQRLLLPRAGS